MVKKYDDIEDLIDEIEHIRSNLHDHLLGSVFWEEAMKNLIEKRGGTMIELLHELADRRDRDAAG